MLVSVMVYMVIQLDSVGGVHDRTAEVRYLGENTGCKGADTSKSEVEKNNCIDHV